VRNDKPFPESMYAFAAVHELSRLTPWWARHVPVIPTLRRERRGGYDVRFELPGTVLLIQYKLSKRRQQLQLSEAQKSDLAIVRHIRGLAQSGIDQFWTTDHQHRLMARISTKFPFCYYAAPRFTSKGDLDFLFDNKQIMASSMIVKLDQFPPVRRGSSCRHRVVAPIGFNRHFIFSDPSTHPVINMKKELRALWRSWSPDKPLAESLQDIWKWAPRGNKTRAIAHARREIAILKRLPPEPDFGIHPIEAPQDLLPPPASVEPGTSLAITRRRRRPPWPINTFGPLEVRSELGGELDHLERLTAISYLFDLIGIQMSVVQPSEKSMD
jgi:hypothetical protein